MIRSVLKKKQRAPFWFPLLGVLIIIGIVAFTAGVLSSMHDERECAAYADMQGFTSIYYKQRCYLKVGKRYTIVIPENNEIVVVNNRNRN